MHCKGCNSNTSWWVTSTVLQGTATEFCSECSSSQSPDVSNMSGKQNINRINEKATKNLKNGKHIYVPPLNEHTTGGVFVKT